MELSAEQLEKLRERAADGTSLSDIQKLLEEDFGICMTYMQVRFFLDDNGIELSSPKPEPTPEPEPDAESDANDLEDDEVQELVPADVSVSVDRLTRPGTVMSGDVTFSDGVTAKWYLDQTGRLGLDGTDANYRPSQEDVQKFQMELQRMAQEQGY